MKKSGGCPVQVKGGVYYWVRKAVVILFPAYILCCMFGVLDPPKPLVQNAWNDVRMALGQGPRIFTAAELKAEGRGVRPMLSILGEVFDVSKGDKHYGKKGAYRGFTGRDATRAFVSGDFSEAGLTDDLSGLEPSKCLGIKDWHAFYKNDKKYKQRGILAGRFYDAKGRSTEALADFERCVEEGKRAKALEAAEKLLYPNCNSKWSAKEGGRVWCPDPKKVPRKFRQKAVHGADIRSAETTRPGEGQAGGAGNGQDAEASQDAAKAKGRCSCFDPDYAEANRERLLSFAGCAPDANMCITKPPEPMKPRK
ncbi:unnamed protein product [Ascophyllum nodosum]